MTTGSRILLVAAAAVTLAGTASALPRFAARTGAKCQSCHVNPTGGGLRQNYGFNYGRDELPVPTWSQDLGMDDALSPLLMNILQVGADLRTLYYWQDSPSGSSNAFWQMQGDLYLNLRLGKKVSIYLDKGLYSGFEAFGLLNILPANGHIKVGKFLPGYGVRMDDHRLYTRTVTGFSPETGRAERTGLEVGFAPGSFSVLAGLFNSSDGFGISSSKKSFLGRVDGLFEVGEEVHLGLGANVFTRESDAGKKTLLYGGQGMAGWGDLAVVGEVDWVKDDSLGVERTGLVWFAEVNYVVTPGVDLKVILDYYDPDVDLQSGSMMRYSFGLEFFPLAGVEVRPLYRVVTEKPTSIGNDEFQLLIHFYL
jgi:hypothetical protein